MDFNDLTNNLTIGYTYHLGGGLKSITDPFNSTVNYTNDRTGRVTAVDGTAWAQNTTGDYASNIKYRAFGQVKQMDYVMPNGTSQIKLEYDNRLRVNHNSVTQAGSTTSFLMKADFNYLADSRLASKDDLLDNAWDRTNKYDFAGRLMFNQFGMGQATGGGTKRVYEQNIVYDGFSNMTTRSGEHWENGILFSASYTNGRKNALTGETLTFDASGNIVYSQPSTNDPHSYQDTKFDAAGRRTIFNGKTKGRVGGWLNYVSEEKNEQVSDGEGRPVIEKTGQRNYHINNVPTTTLTTTVRAYQVWSTVLGSSVAEVAPNGTILTTKVFAGGAVIANLGENGVGWTTADPVTGTVGSFGYSSQGNSSGVENTEPLGQKIHQEDPETYEAPSNQTFTGSADDPEWQCQVPENFLPVSCQIKAEISNSLNGTGIYSYYDPDKKPGDPTFIHVNDRPSAGTQGGTDRLMHQNLHQTDKPLDLSHDGAKIQLASVPDEDGKKDEDDDTIYGPANGESSVTVRGGPSLPDDFQDASMSGSPNFGDDIGKQLPECLRGFLRPYFPNVQIGNFKSFSPVDDARFIAGLPLYVDGKSNPAITLGLYDIHYDAGQVDLTGGSNKSSIGIIAEEIAHTVQFIALWEKVYKAGTYGLAQDLWKAAYLGESASIATANAAKGILKITTGIGLKQKSVYRDNKYEKEAQAKRADIQKDVEKLAKSPCYP